MRFIITALFLSACTGIKQNKLSGIGLPTFDIQGHRGCRGLEPENTIPAMLHALELGVTTLEMDVVVTQDGALVLSHEPFFSHEISTKPNGEFVTAAEERAHNIYKMTLNETRHYDVGMKPHPRFPRQQKKRVIKPLLGDVIHVVEKKVREGSVKAPFYNIETKCNPETDNIYHPPPAEFVELLMQVITTAGIVDRLIIQSFDFRTLQYLHRHYPDIKTSALIEDFDKKGLDAHLEELGFAPTIYSPHYSLVTSELIKACHNKGMRIIPWTVNEKIRIEGLKTMGVDGIITDYPDMIQ